MAEQVNIASLTIDVDDVIKESAKLKKQIDSLKKSQKELDVTTEDGAEAFAENEVQIKKLSKAYRDNQNFATALDKANEDLTKTMQVEGKSTQQLRDDRAALNQISKNIIGDTEEEIALRDKLNGVIDEQTEALKKQAPGYIEQKENIGGYTEGINAADFNLKSFIISSQEAGGATSLISGGLKTAKTAMISFTKATLAFLATPVGVVLGVIAGAFLLIKNAMDRSEESTTKIKRAFSSFGGFAKGLLKILQPLGDFLIDGLVAGFELVEKGIFKALSAIQRGLEFLGLDAAAASLGNFTEGIEESVTASKELAEAELELAKAQRIARKVQLDYQKDAEKLRQIRDDESRNIQERLKANTLLGALLKKQGEEELALAQKSLDVANLRIQLDGETTEALDEQAEALTEIADIQERIVGQQSEQLVNAVSLREEADAAAAAAALRNENELNQLTQIESKKSAIVVKSEKQNLAVRKKAAVQEVQISDEVAKSNVETTEGALGQVQQLLGENTKKGKAAGIAAALINTYQGATAAFAQTPGGIFVKLLAAGTAVASGLGSVAKIRATPTEFASGDILQGRSHATGGIPFSIGGKLGFEAEGGEALINKRSTAMFAPLLSAINVAGGGKKFASGDILGSTVPGSSIIDYDILASKVAEAYSSIPSPVVSVTEIQEVANSVEVVENLATS